MGLTLRCAPTHRSSGPVIRAGSDTSDAQLAIGGTVINADSDGNLQCDRSTPSQFGLVEIGLNSYYEFTFDRDRPDTRTMSARKERTTA